MRSEVPAAAGEMFREACPFADLREAADDPVFSELYAADVRRGLPSRPGGAEAIGPALLGAEKPVHILQRRATVAEIVDLASIAVVDAETRRRQTALDLRGSIGNLMGVRGAAAERDLAPRSASSPDDRRENRDHSHRRTAPS